MRFEKLIARILLFVLLALGASACQGETPTAVVDQQPSRTPFPTSIPLTDTPFPTSTATLRPSSTPLPTLTLAPSLTPVPTKSPTPGIIGIGFDSGPFRDDFSDRLSGWPIENGADWGFGYFEGGYKMYNNIAYAEVCASRTRSHTDFVINVQATKLSGTDTAYFGVTCRKTGTNYYSLAITGDGHYRILKTTGGIPAVLETGESGAIHKGDGGVNFITAVCQGNFLTLIVNGVEVTTVFDQGPLFGAFVGLVVGTTAVPEVEVKFDNFDSYPTDNAPPVPSGTLGTPATPTNTVSPTP